MIERQTLTFGVRFARGPHEAALDALGVFYGFAERALHARKRAIAEDLRLMMIDAKEAKLRRKNLKPAFMREWGLTGRQYNALDRHLDGRYASVRECAKLNAESLTRKIADVEKTIAKTKKVLEKDRKAKADIAVRKADGKRPTKALLDKVLTKAEWDKAQRTIRNKSTRLLTLSRRLQEAERAADAEIPSVIFGGGDMFAARQRIHPIDAAGQAAWRVRWDAARSGNFVLIGSKGETAGNQTCQARLGPDGATLRMRLPEGTEALVLPAGLARSGLLTLPLRLELRERDLLASVLDLRTPEDRTSIAYRFVRDPDWPASRTQSAWRVMITISAPVGGRVRRDRAEGQVLGVDVNADCLAFALVSADGNPLRRWTVPLGLAGLTTDQRRDRISLACAAAVKAAADAGTSLAIEALDFARKKKEISKDADFFVDPRYARMLSAFAYAQVLSDLDRKAQRAGVDIRRVNPAYTSRIGAVNFAPRYGASRHEAAAIAIARRAQRFSERVNYVLGPRGARTQRPAPEDAGRSVWRQWSRISLGPQRAVTPGKPSSHAPAKATPASTSRDAGTVRVPARGAPSG